MIYYYYYHSFIESVGGEEVKSPFKELREQLKMTQPDITTLTHVPQSHICQVEKGRVDLGERLEGFIDFLETTGRDTHDVKTRHREFMKEKKRELEEGLIARIAASQESEESEGG